ETAKRSVTHSYYDSKNKECQHVGYQCATYCNVDSFIFCESQFTYNRICNQCVGGKHTCQKYRCSCRKLQEINTAKCSYKHGNTKTKKAQCTALPYIFSEIIHIDFQTLEKHNV